MRRTVVLLTVGLLLMSSVAFGQAQRGSVSVTVTDADGAVLPGATVSASSDQSLTRRTAISDNQGRARLVGLDPATNYVVTVTLDGFAGARLEGVRVTAGQDTALSTELKLAEISEELIVTAESPLVDVTKTQAGQDITLQLTESLPTARSYQDYLQLVPGVQDTLGVDGHENPASRSGVNYRDADREGGNFTFSTDNLYFFDGINVTDGTTGGNGADINTEIIQEQSVITGAIPAEFIGAPGLISNVVTKSGGNQFSGSVNYYFQDDSLSEDNDHFANETFSNFDAAATLGGPIWKDKAWFFASYRATELERDIIDENDDFLRTVKRTADQIFGKATWALTDSDVLSFTYLTDPTDEDGDFDRGVPNSADTTSEDGGERWSASYNRVWGTASLELAATDHESDLNQFPKNRANLNSVSFAPGVTVSSAEETLGGAGEDEFGNRATDSVRGSFEYLLDTGWGDHSIKFGIVDKSSTLLEDERTTGDPPATFISLDPRGTNGTVRLCDILANDAACADASADGWTVADFGLSTDETENFRNNLTAAQTSTLLGLWDGNGNGVLDDNEIIGNMTFGSTAGNPNGLINYTRDLETQAGISSKGSESIHYYIQDSWQWNKWSVNAGLRAEDTTFLTDAGDDVGTWDTEVAPRISVAYDVKGDGRSSIGVFYGEYYDAFRDNAIDFAGSLTGRVIEEQVFVDALGEWVNFRFRGGTAVQDAFFAPRIETPVTEEIQIQYKQDLGRNMALEVNLIDRETTNIGEDYGRIYYDIDQYAGAGDPFAPDTFFLGPEFFGFSSLAEIDQVALNFMIGTLPQEAFRDWQGIELVFRKRYSDNWQLLASYNYADGDGNTNSDANFDGAGDVFPLDPRAPNRTGIQPGLVEHLFKVHGSYSWDNGFQVGGSYRWNSGFSLNRNGRRAFGRSVPDLTDAPFPSNGFDGTGGLFGSGWIAGPESSLGPAIGAVPGNEYGVLDARASYVWNVNDRIEVDFFLDIFNVLDDQQVILVNHFTFTRDGIEPLEGINFVEPRRYFLGARLRF
ncbi:MAG: TonB-dependent receptor [Acidobacteriota bacterium]